MIFYNCLSEKKEIEDIRAEQEQAGKDLKAFIDNSIANHLTWKQIISSDKYIKLNSDTQKYSNYQLFKSEAAIRIDTLKYYAKLWEKVEATIIDLKCGQITYSEVAQLVSQLKLKLSLSLSDTSIVGGYCLSLNYSGYDFRGWRQYDNYYYLSVELERKTTEEEKEVIYCNRISDNSSYIALGKIKDIILKINQAIKIVKNSIKQFKNVEKQINCISNEIKKLNSITQNTDKNSLGMFIKDYEKYKNL